MVKMSNRSAKFVSKSGLLTINFLNKQFEEMKNFVKILSFFTII